MTGFNFDIKSDTLEARYFLNICFNLYLKDLIPSLVGWTMSLPSEYFLKLKPKKSNPSCILVICVFSLENCNPLRNKNCSISFWTTLKTFGLSPMITKSSAYLIKLKFRFFIVSHYPFTINFIFLSNNFAVSFNNIFNPI